MQIGADPDLYLHIQKYLENAKFKFGDEIEKATTRSMKFDIAPRKTGI